MVPDAAQGCDGKTQVMATCIWVLFVNLREGASSLYLGGWPQNWHLQQYAAALPDAAQMPAQPMQRQRKSASHPTAPPSHLAFHCCDQLRFDFFFIGLSKRSNGFPVLNLFLDLQVILWPSIYGCVFFGTLSSKMLKTKRETFSKTVSWKTSKF